MRRFIWLLSIISMFILVNCGGGSSSKEAKELLQKILQIVGIPHEIVVNICQDGNENGICENFELQTKVTLNKGDSFNDIWQKITLTEDGKYFLETRDPTKPILLELQDEAKVNYDNGKFTLPFNGFRTYEQNETKELSILASMVDKNYFSDSDLTAIRKLENSTTQDKFYAKLLDALETNINTLRATGLDAQNSILNVLKEMSITLKNDIINNNLPNDLNNCDNNLSCVDNRLELMYNRITIIKEKEITPAIKEINEETTTVDLIGKWKVTDPNMDENVWYHTVTILDDMSCSYDNGYGSCKVSLDGTYFTFSADDGGSVFSGDANGSTSNFCIDGHYETGLSATNCWRRI